MPKYAQRKSLRIELKTKEFLVFLRTLQKASQTHASDWKIHNFLIDCASDRQTHNFPILCASDRQIHNSSYFVIRHKVWGNCDKFTTSAFFVIQRSTKYEEVATNSQLPHILSSGQTNTRPPHPLPPDRQTNFFLKNVNLT